LNTTSVPLDQYVTTIIVIRITSRYESSQPTSSTSSPYDTHCFDYQKYYQDDYHAKIGKENLQFLSHSDVKDEFDHPKESNLYHAS